MYTSIYEFYFLHLSNDLLDEGDLAHLAKFSGAQLHQIHPRRYNPPSLASPAGADRYSSTSTDGRNDYHVPSCVANSWI